METEQDNAGECDTPKKVSLGVASSPGRKRTSVLDEEDWELRKQRKEGISTAKANRDERRRKACEETVQEPISDSGLIVEDPSNTEPTTDLIHTQTVEPTNVDSSRDSCSAANHHDNSYVIRATAVAVQEDDEKTNKDEPSSTTNYYCCTCFFPCCECRIPVGSCMKLWSRWPLFALGLIVIIVTLPVLAVFGVFQGEVKSGTSPSGSGANEDSPDTITGNTQAPTIFPTLRGTYSEDSTGDDSNSTATSHPVLRGTSRPNITIETPEVGLPSELTPTPSLVPTKQLLFPTATATRSPTASQTQPTSNENQSPDSIMWTQVGQDIPPNSKNVSTPSFGHAVAISGSGDWLVVGSPGLGLIETFQLYNEEWAFRSSYEGSATQQPQLGHSVAISQDGAFYSAGAPHNWGDSNSGKAGKVRVWPVGSSRLHGNPISGTTLYDQLGTSISQSANGQYIAIGSPYAGETEYLQVGKVTVYQYISDWVKVGDDIWGNVTSGLFGQAVSLSSDGRVVAVGAQNAGRVYMFSYSSSTNRWSQLGQELVGQGDGTGETVSLSAAGDRVAFGARFLKGQGTYGAVLVYRYDASREEWLDVEGTLGGSSVLRGFDEEEQFGLTVSLSKSGNVVAVGSLKKVQVFGISNLSNGVMQVARIGEVKAMSTVPDECSAGCSVFLSYSPSLAGTRLAVGYKKQNVVRVFEALENS